MNERETKMKCLYFGSGLSREIIRGHRKITLRKYNAGYHDFAEKEIVQGIFRDEGTLLLQITADMKVKRFGEISNQEAEQAGFLDFHDAFRGLRQSYRSQDVCISEDDLLAVIRFEVLKVDGVPVVQYEKGNGGA